MIPIIDYVHAELDNVINDYSKLAIVRHAAQNAVMVIDKYYAHTDESVMYRVAIHTFFFSTVIVPCTSCHCACMHVCVCHTLI